MEYTKTELHTHLVGMLSVEEFVAFIKKLGIEEIILDDEIMVPEELLNDINYQKIQIKHGEHVTYAKMNSYYENRTEIIKYIVNEYAKKYDMSKKKASVMVYNFLINESLRSLCKQGVEYVEISYSFYDRISNFVIADDIKDKIKCRFLLSTQRTVPVESDDPSVFTFKKAAEHLSDALRSGNCVGFDIMGEETQLRDEELDPNNEVHSFKKKLQILLETLSMNEDTTLRIHSGETMYSLNNTLTVLKMIDELSEQTKMKIPPPEIRIGHGVYFNMEYISEYVQLLKKFGCIIEINASSNLLLSNVDDINKIPYNFYIDNGIPIIIATDGHGLYGTTIQREDKIAKIVTGNDRYEKIVMDDLQLLSSKKGRK